MTRLVFGFMWLLHFLPRWAVSVTGSVIGSALFWLIRERREVTRINLRLCFPDMDARRREKLARDHFRAFVRAFLDRGILWWGSAERIKRIVRLEGLEHLRALAGEPAIVLAPHFVGFDVTLSRLSFDFPMALMYSRQKDAHFERVMLAGRKRFGARIFPRQAGVKEAISALQSGAVYYYLPDLDFGPKRAVFVPFFGVSAATVTGLSYIARSTGARVVPCVTRMLPGGRYVARLYPPWTDFPSGDDAADARRMNAFIEERVLEMPEQYHWLHKRFKTRPQGEPKFY
jgi:KDO2-lipid IV(A) lauroyltransferase